MSAISLSYPDAHRARRLPVLGTILILSSLVLVAFAILVLVVSASSAEPTGRAAISQTAIAPVAVPVPTPASMEIQPGRTELPTHSSEGPSEPSVVPVPVPTPPSQ